MPSTTLKGRQFEVRRLRGEDLDPSGNINVDQIKNDQKKDAKDALLKKAPQNLAQHQRAAVNYSEVTTPQRPANRDNRKKKDFSPPKLVSRILKRLTGNESTKDDQNKDNSLITKNTGSEPSRSRTKNRNIQANRNQNRQRRNREESQSNNEGRHRNNQNRNRNRKPRSKSSPNRQKAPHQHIQNNDNIGKIGDRSE